jgi:restriction endonuclease Mrr
MTISFPSSKNLTYCLVEILNESDVPLTSSDIDERIIKKLDLNIDVVSKIRQGNRTELKYRLAWCRTKAKQNGLIERTTNNKWKIKSVSN